MDRGQCESGSWRQLIMMSKSEQCGGLFWHILTFARPRAALGWAAAPPPYSLARSRTFSLVLLLPPLNTGLLLSDPASSLSPTGRPAVYNLSTTIRYGQHSWCCRTPPPPPPPLTISTAFYAELKAITCFYQASSFYFEYQLKSVTLFYSHNGTHLDFSLRFFL